MEMMMAIDDGGPAFPPAMAVSEQTNTRYEGRNGMSLRDYFAAKALAGLLADPQVGFREDEQKAELAAHVYAIADAMLAARSKP